MPRRCWALAMTALLAACGGVDEKVTDPDFQRHLAKVIVLNKVFSDSISYDGDDRSDWKVFYTEQPGIITVTVAFDVPDGSCEVILRDKYGAHLMRATQSNNPRIELPQRVEAGRFFVWVNAPDNNCSTQYSIEARLDPD